jgi:hypothetical protein
MRHSSFRQDHRIGLRSKRKTNPVESNQELTSADRSLSAAQLTFSLGFKK